MADFTVQFTRGVTVEDWTDPAPSGFTSRVNPKANRQLKRHVAKVSSVVRIEAVVNGVSGPLDSALGGRLFVPFVVESPFPRPELVSADGLSSVVSFVPQVAGHYHLRMRRTNGGIWHLHLDAK